MKGFNNQKFLTVYSGVLTLILCVTLLSGFTHKSGVRFDTITVQRINVVEPDGTLRMVLTNNNRIPAIIMHGKEYPDFNNRRGSTTAGIYFYDGEGSESGGLTFGGGRDEDGNVFRNGHFAFDGYNQDQLFSISVAHDGRNHRSAISFFDVPEWSIVELLELLESIQHLPEEEQAAALAEFEETHPSGVRRTALTNVNLPDLPESTKNRLEFYDRANQLRLNAGLDASDEPAVELLDENGNLVHRIPPN